MLDAEEEILLAQLDATRPDGADTAMASTSPDVLASRYKPLTAAELLRMDIPPRRMLLSPWLPAQGAAMLYAPRGLGKTFLGLSIAYAVASGGALMRWQAPTPGRVVCIDGEMPLIELQNRLAGIVSASTVHPPDDDALRFLPADHFRDGLPDLASPEGRALLDIVTDGAALLVMDNLSTLARGAENEGDAWLPMQDTVLHLRRRHVTTLLIHHASKTGGQRGTSRREDILDTVIALRRPDDYLPTEGARFDVHYEKSRGFTGADAGPFEARLQVASDGGVTWEASDLRPSETAAAIAMFTKGETPMAVVKELGVSRATAFRLQKQWREGQGHGG
jgi:putative DNA primase/helicase